MFRIFLISLLSVLSLTVSSNDMQTTELLRVKPSQLQQLEYKVSGRDDVVREEVSPNLHRYLIRDRFETYYFTKAEHPAHPIAVFRGRVSREDGSKGFDQRAWTASTDETAIAELLRTLEALGSDTL